MHKQTRVEKTLNITILYMYTHGEKKRSSKKTTRLCQNIAHILDGSQLLFLSFSCPVCLGGERGPGTLFQTFYFFFRLVRQPCALIREFQTKVINAAQSGSTKNRASREYIYRSDI